MAAHLAVTTHCAVCCKLSCQHGNAIAKNTMQLDDDMSGRIAGTLKPLMVKEAAADQLSSHQIVSFEVHIRLAGQ